MPTLCRAVDDGGFGQNLSRFSQLEEVLGQCIAYI